MNGRDLTLGLVGALALVAVLRRPAGSRALDRRYDPIRDLGYTEAEITRALTAAGQGPRALERGDRTTQTSGPTRQGAYPGLDFRPPIEVREEALRGLHLRKVNERHGKRVDPKTGAGPGGWWIGVGRAIQLATLPAMPPRDLIRMRDYFRRHAGDAASAGAARGRVAPGVVAWRLWGGDAGRAWSQGLVAQMDRVDARARDETHPPGDLALGSRFTSGLQGHGSARGGSSRASAFG